MLITTQPCMRQHVAVPRSGTADAVMAAGMIRAGGGVCACRRPMGMPMLCGAITANARGCDAGTPVWSVCAGATGVPGVGSWRRVEGVPRGAGCAPPAAWPAPGRWHTRRSGSIGSAQPHRGVAPHTTPRGHAPAVCTVAGGGTTTHRPSARAGGRASRRAASQRARLEPQSARVRPHICSMPPLTPGIPHPLMRVPGDGAVVWHRPHGACHAACGWCGCTHTCRPPHACRIWSCAGAHAGGGRGRVNHLRATARGFEPLRAEPNGFRVHLLNRSDTLS